MTENLTDEQRDALASALAEVGLKLEAAFGREVGVILIAKPPDSEVVGLIANMHPIAARQVLQYAIHTGHNPREHIVPMKPLRAERVTNLRSPRKRNPDGAT